MALDAVGLSSVEAVRAQYTAGSDALRDWVGPGPILTDDRPLVEFHRSFGGGPPNPDLSLLNGRAEEVFE
jgi:hypothetical protein